MVLAQKQMYRSMEQNRKPEINPHTYSQEARIYNRERRVSSKSGIVKAGQLRVNQ